MFNPKATAEQMLPGVLQSSQPGCGCREPECWASVINSSPTLKIL